jgi:hypothetical protein
MARSDQNIFMFAGEVARQKSLPREADKYYLGGVRASSIWPEQSPMAPKRLIPDCLDLANDKWYLRTHDHVIGDPVAIRMGSPEAIHALLTRRADDLTT